MCFDLSDHEQVFLKHNACDCLNFKMLYSVFIGAGLLGKLPYAMFVFVYHCLLSYFLSNME